ncbi:MAG: hypothetical protein Q4E16_06210 [Neisseria sp.]|nr:hypothetical protein [Neisseria sp.]
MSIKPIVPVVASVLFPMILAACAGGGHVAIPDTVLPIPTLNPVTLPVQATDRAVADGKMQQFNAGTSETKGKVVAYAFVDAIQALSKNPEDSYRMFYQAPNGKTYPFSTYTNPIFPDIFFPSKSLRTTQDTQKTDDGGQLFACCTARDGSHSGGGDSGYPASQVQHLRYGVWIDKSGKTDLFVGGVLSDPKYLQGATADNNYTPKGKATFELWALRVNGGKVVSSSYLPSSIFPKVEGVKSLMTVNFNTGYLGGTIKGNSNFGADIDFSGVVSGSTFTGRATSGNATGRLDGAFYGDANTGARNQEVGGKFSFTDSSLDAVFGGKAASGGVKVDDTSTDLVPLQ